MARWPPLANAYQDRGGAGRSNGVGALIAPFLCDKSKSFHRSAPSETRGPDHAPTPMKHADTPLHAEWSGRFFISSTEIRRLIYLKTLAPDHTKLIKYPRAVGICFVAHGAPVRRGQRV